VRHLVGYVVLALCIWWAVIRHDSLAPSDPFDR
jgi:hypothetical protein